jgi:hypothetical protein
MALAQLFYALFFEINPGGGKFSAEFHRKGQTHITKTNYSYLYFVHIRHGRFSLCCADYIFRKGIFPAFIQFP